MECRDCVKIADIAKNINLYAGKTVWRAHIRKDRVEIIQYEILHGQFWKFFEGDVAYVDVRRVGHQKNGRPYSPIRISNRSKIYLFRTLDDIKAYVSEKIKAIKTNASELMERAEHLERSLADALRDVEESV